MLARRTLLILSASAGLATVLTLGALASYRDDEGPPPAPVAAAKSPAVRRGTLIRRKGGTPLVAQPPEPPAEPRSVPPGISVTFAPRATPAEKTLLAPVVAGLGALRFEPPERRRHFQWMDQYQAELSRWEGEIQGYQVVPGGVRVRVRIWPIVGLPNMQAAHLDFFLEDYLYTNDGIIYVGHEDPGPHQGFIRL